jgi:FixJ family two-component response regulator
MPDRDGYELLSYVKKQLPWVSVIVVSAYCDAHVEARLKSMGAARCLEKPLALQDIVDALASV